MRGVQKRKVLNNQGQNDRTTDSSKKGKLWHRWKGRAITSLAASTVALLGSCVTPYRPSQDSAPAAHYQSSRSDEKTELTRPKGRLEELKESLNSDNKWIRSSAIYSLGDIAEEDADPRVRERAIGLLEQVADRDEDAHLRLSARSELIGILRHEKTDALKRERIVQIFERGIEKESGKWRDGVMEYLSYILNDVSRESLTLSNEAIIRISKILLDGHSRMRHLAIGHLVYLEGTDANLIEKRVELLGSISHDSEGYDDAMEGLVRIMKKEHVGPSLAAKIASIFERNNDTYRLVQVVAMEAIDPQLIERTIRRIESEGRYLSGLDEIFANEKTNTQSKERILKILERALTNGNNDLAGDPAGVLVSIATHERTKDKTKQRIADMFERILASHNRKIRANLADAGLTEYWKGISIALPLAHIALDKRTSSHLRRRILGIFERPGFIMYSSGLSGALGTLIEKEDERPDPSLVKQVIRILENHNEISGLIDIASALEGRDPQLIKRIVWRIELRSQNHDWRRRFFAAEDVKCFFEALGLTDATDPRLIERLIGVLKRSLTDRNEEVRSYAELTISLIISSDYVDSKLQERLRALESLK